MFCKNCGATLSENEKFCPNCGCSVDGSAPAQKKRYCRHCGNELSPNAYVCVKCGCKVESEPAAKSAVGGKSKLAGGLLGIFLGTFGVHNFYLGYTGKAVAQLLITILSFGMLSGVSAIWGLIEGIMILAGSINTDGNGKPLSD